MDNAAAAYGGKSQEFIQQLLEAEKKADEIVSTAKKNRLAMLRQAKEKAEEDAKTFRDTMEAKFQSEIGGKAAKDPTAELGDSTRAEVDMVHSDYASNRAKAVSFVAGKVLDVSLGLTQTQKMVLKIGIA
mmetsp:Transcript_34984/g.96764  ORF Transcript_34984/g.96764 Transcript_34984/m.96764 type:complete len:130 (-) Transcript_34984:170-559(-)|eukprot:CAMPEP_0117557470 /NCGR_PEP_ID=MMETSP0784-20121206/52344_1 /TAXON_ID=39447 /ORGANISM="" /LENGTH=129 /DNA_ID=CAMNT_0005354783 /DNA_START=96 /DNA_END=485 /DNA_ORIENTATION=-